MVPEPILQTGSDGKCCMMRLRHCVGLSESARKMEGRFIVGVKVLRAESRKVTMFTLSLSTRYSTDYAIVGMNKEKRVQLVSSTRRKPIE